MRAELYRSGDPDTVVAVATWNGERATIGPAVGAPQGLETILRPTPVVVEDASLRRQGAHGETLLQPGTFEWFRAALLTRCGAFGLGVRFVSGVRAGGWDPASRSGTFEEQIGRLTATDP